MPSIYCIDTSALLHGWRRDYPLDVFPGVWETLDRLVDSGRLISCDEVLLEIERGGDDLYEWLKTRDQMFHEPSSDVQDVVRDIVARWPLFVPEESHDGIWADPYIIALGSVKNGTVITGEKPANENARRPKIPNVCQSLGVKWGNLLDLLRAEDCNFQ